MRPPSGANTALVTQKVWPWRMASGLPSRVCQSDLSLRSVECAKNIRGTVIGGGQDAAAVGREHRAGDPEGVALEDGERLAVGVPQPRRPVIGGGQDAAAVGRERRAGDPVGVALEGGERLAVAVPQPRRGGPAPVLASSRPRRAARPLFARSPRIAMARCKWRRPYANSRPNGRGVVRFPPHAGGSAGAG
jgi:hypothetical protein